jgi:hypothetical protein
MSNNEASLVQNKLEGALGLAVVVAGAVFAGMHFFRFLFLELVVLAEFGVLLGTDVVVVSIFC